MYIDLFSIITLDANNYFDKSARVTIDGVSANAISRLADRIVWPHTHTVIMKFQR